MKVNKNIFLILEQLRLLRSLLSVEINKEYLKDFFESWEWDFSMNFLRWERGLKEFFVSWEWECSRKRWRWKIRLPIFWEWEPIFDSGDWVWWELRVRFEIERMRRDFSLRVSIFRSRFESRRSLMQQGKSLAFLVMQPW